MQNAQANVVVERAHQMLGYNQIRSFELQDNPYYDQDDPWTGILSVVAFAMRATFHTSYYFSSMPGQLVFRRDMTLNQQCLADWTMIKT